jgi:predicted nucleotidyltransferase
MSELEKIKRKKKTIQKIADRYGVTKILIFGSVARGEDRTESDIDLLVTLEKNKTLFDLGGFYMDLSKLLGKEISIVTSESVTGRFKENIIRDSITL